MCGRRLGSKYLLLAESFHHPCMFCKEVNLRMYPFLKSFIISVYERTTKKKKKEEERCGMPTCQGTCVEVMDSLAEIVSLLQLCVWCGSREC